MILVNSDRTLFYQQVCNVRNPLQTFNTTHSKSDLQNTVRIIRPHHPFFGKTVNLVKIWQHRKKRYYVIELPDKSHTRIPLDWADQGKTPLPKSPSSKQVFTVQSVREITFLIRTLENKSSNDSTRGLSFPHRLSKEDEYGKTDGLLPNGGQR